MSERCKSCSDVHLKGGHGGLAAFFFTLCMFIINCALKFREPVWPSVKALGW